MHELSVTMGIVSIVLQKAEEVQAHRVTRIDVKIGRLAGIIPDCVRLQFDILSKGTIASGADLFFDQPPLNVRCRECDISYFRENTDLTCPNCRGGEIDILSGFELSVDSMEVE